jgi:hypothetical protein
MGFRVNQETQKHFGAIAAFSDRNGYTFSAIADENADEEAPFCFGFLLDKLFRYAQKTDNFNKIGSRARNRS